MQILEIMREDIFVPPDRQRREFEPESLMKLVESIISVGLIHPIIVRQDEDGQAILVAGERRLKALEYIWNFGQEVKCGDHIFPENLVPCIDQGEMDSVDAFEMELEENVRRTDLTWQERAKATAALAELRRLQAERSGEDPPTTAEIAAEVRPSDHPVAAHEATRDDLILARNLSDPDVAKASSAKEGMKILKRKEEERRNQEHGELIGRTFNAGMHSLVNGDCLKVLETFPKESFDVILTDPPYGIDAQDFGDSGGMAEGGHFYDDSMDNWLKLMGGFAPLSFAVAKPQSHLYLFCDVENFVSLRFIVSNAGWKCFRTPLIWVNPGGSRAPWPTMGPQRKYQCILYAVKGDRNVTRIYSDVLTYPTDVNLGHPAQKPVAVLTDLLQRSIRAGDTILDPFCGSGSIFPAAHALKVKATGIEMSPVAYGLAAKRLGELK